MIFGLLLSSIHADDFPSHLCGSGSETGVVNTHMFRTLLPLNHLTETTFRPVRLYTLPHVPIVSHSLLTLHSLLLHGRGVPGDEQPELPEVCGRELLSGHRGGLR